MQNVFDVEGAACGPEIYSSRYYERQIRARRVGTIVFGQLLSNVLVVCLYPTGRCVDRASAMFLDGVVVIVVKAMKMTMMLVTIVRMSMVVRMMMLR